MISWLDDGFVWFGVALAGLIVVLACVDIWLRSVSELPDILIVCVIALAVMLPVLAVGGLNETDEKRPR